MQDKDIYNVGKLLNNQKIKYLFVGIYNTVFVYLVFVLLFFYFSSIVNYALLLGLCHIIGVTNNFFTYKAFVFKVKKNNWQNYLKFNLVYLFTYLLNLVLLVILTKQMNLNIYLAQGLIIILIAIVGFFLNKNYSFSRQFLYKTKKN